MVSVCPLNRVVGPLPNGRTPWLINGGDPNYLLTGMAPASRNSFLSWHCSEEMTRNKWYTPVRRGIHLRINQHFKTKLLDWWNQGWFTRDPQGHVTPENGKRDPYYGTHIFRDSKMGVVPMIGSPWKSHWLNIICCSSKTYVYLLCMGGFILTSCWKDYSPKKINMSPENEPFQKENCLSAIIFRWSI